MKNQIKQPDVLLTSQGQKDLQAELEELKNVKLPAVLDRIAKAREEGDLSENSAYQFGKQEQEFIEGRIEQLQDVLRNATLVASDGLAGGLKGVSIGCKVVVSLGGKKHNFIVVGDWEANPAEKKISAGSPLGKALIGKKIGEKAEVSAPAGKVVYTVVEIE